MLRVSSIYPQGYPQNLWITQVIHAWQVGVFALRKYAVCAWQVDTHLIYTNNNKYIYTNNCITKSVDKKTSGIAHFLQQAVWL